jgi:two-component system sensor kinase FixL
MGMASNPASEAADNVAGSAPASEALAKAGLPSQPGSWFLRQLDSLLSEELRGTAATELVRYRVLAGASLFLLVMCVLFLAYGLWMERSLVVSAFAAFVLVGCGATLVLLRKQGAVPRSAMILCTMVSLAIAGALFHGQPGNSTHVATMLGPLLAVYLLRPRASLLVTAGMSVLLAIAFPLYQFTFSDTPLPSWDIFWELHILAGLSVLAGWSLGALHTTARDEAETALQQALKNMRDSEGKLLSLIESTDDLWCMLDMEGNLVLGNTAVKVAYRKLTGHEPAVGKPFFKWRPELWKQRYDNIRAGQRLRLEEEYVFAGQPATMETSFHPIKNASGEIIGVSIFTRNITARKQAEAKLGDMHRTLVDVSRQAGMAEVATGVLHNVGNTLNSVNVAANVITDKLRKLRVAGLIQATDLLGQHSGQELATFLTNDARGQQLPGYFRALAEHLRQEQQMLLDEMEALNKGIDHIKSIVTMQQEHARSIGAVDLLPVPRLVDEALKLHMSTLKELGIRLDFDYADVPPILVDRHKLLQILLNLLNNARHSIMESNRPDKHLAIRVRRHEDGRRLLIEVADNGVGIAAENLPRIFTQGFTTKKDGHGFGLHISALAAAEMKGKLSCASPGPGLGATFTLELPMEVNEPAKA